MVSMSFRASRNDFVITGRVDGRGVQLFSTKDREEAYTKLALLQAMNKEGLAEYLITYRANRSGRKTYHDVFDLVDGWLVWKEKPSTKASRVTVGQRAGILDSEGYVKISLNRKTLRAGRVVWEMFFGEIPEGMEVDHINGVRHDNRIENLRLYTDPENSRNNRRKREGSGTPGVCYHVDAATPYEARITINKVGIYLGVYSTEKEAIAVRVRAENLISSFTGDVVAFRDGCEINSL